MGSKRKSHYKKEIATRNTGNFLPPMARANQQNGIAANFNGNSGEFRDAEELPV